MKIQAAAMGLLLAAAPAAGDLKEIKARGTLRVIAAADERAATWNRLLVKYFGDQALDVLGRKP